MLKQQLYDEGLAQERWDREHQAEMQTLFWQLADGKVKTSNLTAEQRKLFMAWCEREEKRVREQIRLTNEKIKQIDDLLSDIVEIKKSTD